MATSERNRDRLLKSTQPYQKESEDQDPQVHPWERPDRLSVQDLPGGLVGRPRHWWEK